MLPGMAGIAGFSGQGATSQPLTVSHTQRKTSSGITSIGAEPTGGDRRFVVVVAGGNNSSAVDITGCTIGGNPATEIALNHSTSTANATVTHTFWLEVSTGTTANIVVSFSNAVGSGFDVYSVISGPDGAVLGNVYEPTVENNPSATVSANAGSVLIGAAMARNGGPFTWTYLTEQSEATISTGDYLSTATSEEPTALNSQTVGVTGSNGADGHAMTIVELRGV